mgnify:CR=1 FL=1
MKMKKILFVCLGNICRSSTAEGVMLHLIKEAGLEEGKEMKHRIVIRCEGRSLRDFALKQQTHRLIEAAYGKNCGGLRG